MSVAFIAELSPVHCCLVTPHPSTFCGGPQKSHLQSRQPSLALLSHRGSCCFYRPLYWLLQCVRLPPDVDHQVHMFLHKSYMFQTEYISDDHNRHSSWLTEMDEQRLLMCSDLASTFPCCLMLVDFSLVRQKPTSRRKVDLHTSIPHLFHQYMLPLTSRCGWVYIQCSPLGPLQDSTEVGDQCHGLNSPFKFLF